MLSINQGLRKGSAIAEKRIFFYQVSSDNNEI